MNPIIKLKLFIFQIKKIKIKNDININPLTD